MLAGKNRPKITNWGATGCCAWMKTLHNILREITASSKFRQAQNASQFKKAAAKQQHL
jgi:hypothetical protein